MNVAAIVMRFRTAVFDKHPLLCAKPFRAVAIFALIIIVTYFYFSRRSNILERRTTDGLTAGTDGRFYIDSRPTRILSGAIHYFRVVPEYWRDRLLKLRKTGMNAVETYVPWNLHEEVKGRFKFSGNLNIRQFIETAAEVGLFVILRPGPYICAEWDLGGLPSWLLSDPDMKVRETYSPYLNAVQHYFEHLLPLVQDLQYSYGGPIIAFQVENEYASYGDDASYLTFLMQLFKANGIHELLFTSDGSEGTPPDLPNVLKMVNFHGLTSAQRSLAYLDQNQPGRPKMVAEYWSGWFDHWGEEHHTYALTDFEEPLQFILNNYGNVNVYMFHGGTNFGFMNGANQFDETSMKSDYAATITSYDYAAPLSESGEMTDKYFKLQEMLKPYISGKQMLYLGPLPDGAAALQIALPHRYGIITMQHYMPLGDILFSMEAIHSPSVMPMEQLAINNGGGQGYGFIVYETRLVHAGLLTISGRVRDRALILINGKELAVTESAVEDFTVNVLEHGRLDILVENMGRVNFVKSGKPFFNNQRKGLLMPVTLNQSELHQWSIYPLDFSEDAVWDLTLSQRLLTYVVNREGLSHAGMYVGEVVIYGTPRDTFVDMLGWTKGVVFVNGHNIGRYWSVGPQRTLYLPAPLLKTGVNKISVFELHKSKPTIELVDRPQLSSSKG